MKIDEKELRKTIRLESKLMIAESEIAQGLENVAGQAKSQLEGEISDMTLESDQAWEAFDLVKKAAVQIAADYLMAPPQQVSSYVDERQRDEEMDVQMDVIGSVTMLALLIVQGYQNAEGSDGPGGMGPGSI